MNRPLRQGAAPTDASCCTVGAIGHQWRAADDSGYPPGSTQSMDMFLANARPRIFALQRPKGLPPIGFISELQVRTYKVKIHIYECHITIAGSWCFK